MSIFSGTGKSKKQQKAELAAYITNSTNSYLQAGKDYFKGDIAPLEPVIAKAVENKTINTPEVHHNLIKQAITHLVKTGKTENGKVRPYKNHPWMQQQNISKALQNDQIMINYMIARVSEKCNDTVVELVQTGLQAWSKSQQTINNAERLAAQNLYKKCYNTLQNHAQLKNIACNKSAVQKDDMQKLLGEYKSEFSNYQLKSNVGSQPTDKVYVQRLENRAQALEQDLQQHKTTTINLLPQVTNNALGFMFANNINYASFHNIDCTQFQHCMTREIIGILNTSADMAYRNGYAPVITQLAYYNCNLAVSAQQLNQLSYIKEAATFTDICHFFTVYSQIMLDHEFQVRQWKEVGVGVAQGAAQALYKWAQFAEQLYTEPS